MHDAVTRPTPPSDATAWPRRRTHAVQIGGVTVGGGKPVVVQSMTNTDTSDVASSVKQVAELWRAGSEMVRLTVNTVEAAAAIPRIVDKLAMMGIDVPLIGDFHYNGHQLLTAEPACAEALAKYRINPGNVGFGKKKDLQFAQLIEFAIRYNKPVRIGANWGSLDQALAAKLMDENNLREQPWDAGRVLREALIRSALDSAEQAVELGLPRDRIVLSAKVSGVQELIAVYRDLAQRSDFALHLGLTEAGIGSKGIVASSAALSVLLQEGIGDTIRISLTPEPGQSRTQEVIVAQELFNHRPARLHAAGHGLPGLRPHHLRVLPGAGQGGTKPRAREDAAVEDPPPGCGEHDPGGDGLHRQRTG